MAQGVTAGRGGGAQQTVGSNQGLLVLFFLGEKQVPLPSAGKPERKGGEAQGEGT